MPRAPKRCGRTGCDQRITGRTYCPTHTAEQQQRANTNARGYGYDHQQARSAALASFTDGQRCPRCDQPIHAGQPVDLDHTDDRASYLGLSHRRCNARAGATTRRGSPPPTR